MIFLYFVSHKPRLQQKANSCTII